MTPAFLFSSDGVITTVSLTTVMARLFSIITIEKIVTVGDNNE